MQQLWNENILKHTKTISGSVTVSPSSSWGRSLTAHGDTFCLENETWNVSWARAWNGPHKTFTQEQCQKARKWWRFWPFLQIILYPPLLPAFSSRSGQRQALKNWIPRTSWWHSPCCIHVLETHLVQNDMLFSQSWPRPRPRPYTCDLLPNFRAKKPMLEKRV